MKKILIISPYINNSYAGWAKFTGNLLKHFNHKLNEESINVLCLENEQINNLDFNFKFIKNVKFESKFGKLLYSYKVLKYILFKRNQFKIIFLPNLYLFSSIIGILKPFISAKLIGRVCANEIHFIKKTSFLKKYLLKNFDEIIVLNLETHTSVQKLGIPSNKIHYIPNPVDNIFFNSFNSIHKYDILFVGEISRRKRLDHLLGVFNQLRKNFNKISLCIVGPVTDKNYEVELQKLYKYKEDSGITVKGQISREELVKVYNESKIFVLPSKSEGMPNVLLEAMSCGLTVVASNIPGIKENVKNGVNGFLIDHHDDSLHTILETLLLDQKKLKVYGASARKFIVDNRNPQSIYFQYSVLLKV